MAKQKERPAIGCRIDADELEQIDEILTATGQSRSQWLYQLVRSELGRTAPATVQTMLKRLEAIERKLARLRD